MPFVNEQKNERTIDYERNIIFKRLPTPFNDERIEEFELSLGGKIVPFMGQITRRQLENGKLEMNWRITNLKDSDIEYHGESILKIISEALECWGYFLFTEDIQTVNVTLRNIVPIK